MYVIENMHFFLFFDNKVAMQEFALYSCSKERSITNLQNDNNVRPFQYRMSRRQKNDRQKVRRVCTLR